MSTYKDRRSVAGEVKQAVDSVMDAARDAEQNQAVPGLRRPGPGHRTASDFFTPDKQRREVSRGELLNVLGMMEFARRENRWHRRVWRWLTKQPMPVDFGARLADAHERTLEDVKARMLANLAAVKAKVAEVNASQSLRGKGADHA